jgi:enhancing lycopene biosynthesis protein 2
MVKVGVVLSGCGFLDGAEIHEAVLTAYFLEREGAELVFCAPDTDQMHVIDHRTGKVVEGTRRNVLAESARIARGEITAVKDVSADDIDALVLPGGFGAAKNLCDFAVKGPECTVDPGVEQLIRDVHAAGKPIGALCIAPAVVARVLGDGVTLTVGTDKDTAEALTAMGAKHKDRPVDEILFDEAHRVVSTPAYMLGPGITDVARGIEACCKKVMELASSPTPVI